MSEKNDSGRVLDVRSLARLTFITEHDVRACVRHIAGLAGDPEMAHVHEDEMRDVVLAKIASSTAVNPGACAKAARESEALEFPRRSS